MWETKFSFFLHKGGIDPPPALSTLPHYNATMSMWCVHVCSIKYAWILSNLFFSNKKKVTCWWGSSIDNYNFFKMGMLQKTFVQHLGSNEKAPCELFGALQENKVFLTGKISQNVP